MTADSGKKVKGLAQGLKLHWFDKCNVCFEWKNALKLSNLLFSFRVFVIDLSVYD
jgi:hypothetical protein